jgi:lipoprotein-releasing system permease protein
MSFRIFIAKKFIASRRESWFVTFITLIAIIGVAIGVASLIIAISVLSGFDREITDRTVSLSSHIQITSFKSRGIEDYNSVINFLNDSIPGIKSAAPYTQKEAVLKFKDKTEGIIAKGIRNNDNIFGERREIVAGEQSVGQIDSTVSRIVIGSKLASKFRIEIGDKIFILATNGIPSLLNPPNIKQFKVTGIYESGLREYDDVMLYIDLADAQWLFDMGENVTGIEIMLSQPDRIEETNQRIKAVLGYPYNSRTIYKIFKGLFTWVELQKEPIPIIIGLIIIVAAFNVIGILLMIVLEKTRDVGILKTLGSSGKDIMRIFAYQGFFIAVIGIAAGNVLGYGLCVIQLKYNIISLPEIYFMNKVPILLDWQTGVITSVIAFMVTMLAALVPSYLASRLSPVNALRFN